MDIEKEMIDILMSANDHGEIVHKSNFSIDAIRVLHNRGYMMPRRWSSIGRMRVVVSSTLTQAGRTFIMGHEMRDYAIGEKFDHNGKKLAPEAAIGCEGCACAEPGHLCFADDLMCSGELRKDHTEVRFVEVKHD